MKIGMNGLVLALVAAVLVAGCVSNNVSVNTTPPKTGGKTVNVAITDNGFEPADVSIDAGDTVVWTNMRSSTVWPASDDHPTHTKLPGFDPLRGLAPGEKYQFTFIRAGTWGYHDHLHPTFIGTVIVK